MALEGAALLAAAMVFAWSVAPAGGWKLRGEEGDWMGGEVWRGAEPPGWLLPLDDAYIFVRYAQQWGRGRFLEWSDGEPSSGASSFLYLMALLPPHLTGGEGNLAAWSAWSRWVGVAALWLLGWAGALLLREAGSPPPWPLAGGLVLVWSGAVGFGAVAGMESAGNAALVVLACALWARAWRTAPRRAALGAAAIALLPLARPENLALTLAAAAAALLGIGPLPRRWVPLLLLPAAAWGAVLSTLTGDWQPAGAIAKSWVGAPFLPAGALLRQAAATARELLLPIYLGSTPDLLPFPVGLLATATAVAALGLAARHRGRLAAFAPLAFAWLVLLALAPLSGTLLWQQMRHHHAGLACAWLLAVAGLSAAAETLLARRGGRGGSLHWLALLLPVPLFLHLPYWQGEHRRAARELWHRHAPALAWLSEHGRGETLLVNDGGLPALVHDGPAVDLMGLGTPALTRAYSHGPGAVVEALARRPVPPALAAVSLDLVAVRQLLGPPLLPPEPRRTLVAPVRRELLRGTPRAAQGIDFAWLPDEARGRLVWRLPPATDRASFALAAPRRGGATLQGCRPLHGGVGIALPRGSFGVRGTAAPLTAAGAALQLFAGDARGPRGPALAHAAQAGFGWFDVVVAGDLPAGARYLWVERAGRGLPCLESVRWRL
ncbi:MAG TPA: hypothetical protein VF121_13645 [Thermoanaerobaculia bacterium]|nr:hypothetical protein [Thermoanaerobaculia bacterium]